MVPVYPGGGDEPTLRGGGDRRRPQSAHHAKKVAVGKQQDQSRNPKPKAFKGEHPWLDGRTGLSATAAGRNRPKRVQEKRRQGNEEGRARRLRDEVQSRNLQEAGPNRGIGVGRVAKPQQEASYEDDLMVPPEQRIAKVQSLVAMHKAKETHPQPNPAAAHRRPPLHLLALPHPRLLLPCQANGELDRVVELQIELMALTHLQHGAASIEMAHAYWSLADTYLRKQLPEQALEHAQRSYKISAALGYDEAAMKFSPTILLTLGMCHTLLKRYAEAEKWMQKALRLTEDLHGEDHPACILVHMGFANLHQLRGKPEQGGE